MYTAENMPEYGGFHSPVFSRIRTDSTSLSLHGRIWVCESPYSFIFYAVIFLIMHKINPNNAPLASSGSCEKTYHKYPTSF